MFLHYLWKLVVVQVILYERWRYVALEVIDLLQAHHLSVLFERLKTIHVLMMNEFSVLFSGALHHHAYVLAKLVLNI